MKAITLDELTDKVYGKKGTPERDEYDREVELFVIGETIKQARESKSLSQEKLGEMVGLKKSSISNIEKGKNLSFDAFLRIFKAMGISVKMQLETIGEMSLC
jgi:DNA-binding XRE family transcriptional regulator